MNSEQFIMQEFLDYGYDGGNGGHGGHVGGRMCSMKMLFNLDTERICIVFSWWRVNGIGSLILSCFIIALLAASFEFLRFISRKYDEKICESPRIQLQEGGNANSEEAAEVSPPATENGITYVQRSVRTLIHTVQVFLSFFIMLIFMTYNGYLMLSVVIGAAIGYFVFAKHTLSDVESGGRPITCH